MTKFYIYSESSGFLMGVVHAASLKEARENAKARFPFDKPVVREEKLPEVAVGLDHDTAFAAAFNAYRNVKAGAV